MRKKIFGCFVDSLDMEETLQVIESFIKEGTPHQHVVVNVDKIVKANRDPDLRNIINKCDLINSDGMPLVWASKLLGKPIKQRVTGIDLFFRLLEKSEKKGWRCYFLGAREHVVSAVIKLAKEMHPDLKIAGYRNGYWSHEQEKLVAESIRESRPDILFVAISSPKKEEFLEHNLKDMGVPFSMGVGGTFDVMIGLTKRAPKWMQNCGMEWFYRFLQEPKRMAKRYFWDDIFFFILLLNEFRKHWILIIKSKIGINTVKDSY